MKTQTKTTKELLEVEYFLFADKLFFTAMIDKKAYLDVNSVLSAIGLDPGYYEYELSQNPDCRKLELLNAASDNTGIFHIMTLDNLLTWLAMIDIDSVALNIRQNLLYCRNNLRLRTENFWKSKE